MGLKNIIDALGGFVTSGSNAIENVINSQYKEYIVSGDMTGVLMKRGEFVLAEDSKNRWSRRNDKNIITSGSRIDIQRNQAMIIVDSGKIVEYCDVEGQYVYDASSAPSLFSSSDTFGERLKKTVLEIWNQTTAGGTRVSTQRVYFISKGPIIPELKWGCGNAVFRHTINTPGLPPFQQLIKIQAHGKAQFAITDPVTFFDNYGCKKVGGDNDGLYTVEEAFEDGGPFALIKPSINQAVAASFSKLGTEQPLMYDELAIHTEDIGRIIKEKNGSNWERLYGINLVVIVFNGAPVPEDEYIEKIQQLAEKAAMSANANLMQFEIEKDRMEAYKAAGENGGISGLYGMGLTMGNTNTHGNIFSNNQQIPNMQPMGGFYNQTTPMQQTTTSTDMWKCSCNTNNTTKFCVNCGAKKPINGEQPTPANNNWQCSCGSINSTKFCKDCGNPKPIIKKYKCDKCGWQPEDNTKPPRFCPECGDIFNDEDLI